MSESQMVLYAQEGGVVTLTEAVMAFFDKRKPKFIGR